MQSGRRIFALCVVGAAAGTAAPAWAERPQTEQGVRVPVRAEQVRHVSVTAILPIVYDTNVTRSSKARAIARGLDREDFRFSPGGAVDLYVPLGRTTFTLLGAAGYDIYTNNHRLNAERINLDGSVDLQYGRCSSSSQGSYYRARSDLGDLGSVAADPLFDSDNVENVVTAGLLLSCSATVGISPFASVQATKADNSNDRRKGQDYRTLTYGGGLIYSQPSIGEIGLVGSIDDSKFDNRTGGPGALFPGLDDFSVRSAGIFFNRRVSRQFTGRIQINYTDVSASGNGHQFNGLSGSATIGLSTGGPARIDLTVMKSAEPSLAYNVDYVVATRATVLVGYQLSPLFGLSAGYTLRSRDFYASIPDPVNPLTDDKQHNVNVDARYQYGRRLAFVLGAAYETRNANNTFYNYDDFRVLFSTRLSLR